MVIYVTLGQDGRNPADERFKIIFFHENIFQQTMCQATANNKIPIKFLCTKSIFKKPVVLRPNNNHSLP